MLDHFLHVPRIAHNRVSGAGLCNGGVNVQLTKGSCVFKLNKEILHISGHTDGLYPVDFKMVVEQKTVAVKEKNFSVLHVCLAMLLQLTILPSSGWQKKCCPGYERNHRPVLDDCSPCIDATMTNTIMPSRTSMEVRPGAVIYIIIIVMIVVLVDTARYFATSINEESGIMNAFDMSSNGQAAQLLKGQVCLVEHHCRFIVKQNVWMAKRNMPWRRGI